MGDEMKNKMDALQNENDKLKEDLNRLQDENEALSKNDINHRPLLFSLQYETDEIKEDCSNIKETPNGNNIKVTPNGTKQHPECDDFDAQKQQKHQQQGGMYAVMTSMLEGLI